jgi:MoxR-like ATPase
LKLLGEANYLADRSLATCCSSALKWAGRSFSKARPGVGKTEIAKVLAQTLRAAG